MGKSSSSSTASQSLKKIDVVLSLWIPPSYLGNVKRGAYCQLENFLLSYVDQFGGVVVAFSNVNVLGHGGLIYYDQPEIHFRVSVQFLVFSPFSGERLKGVISHVGYDHIGVIVHGIFNASIPAPHEIEKFKVGNGIDFIVKDVVRLQHIPGLKIIGRLELSSSKKSTSSGKLNAQHQAREVPSEKEEKKVDRKKKRNEESSDPSPKKKHKKTKD
jgi:hypothetical protein